MKADTREKFNRMLETVCDANAINDPSKKFAVNPGVERSVNAKMTENSDFLNKINIVPVTEQSGEKLGIGIGAPIASRIDTKTEDREPQELSPEEPDLYHCKQTNFDTALRYQTIDSMAVLPQVDFVERYRAGTIVQVALDRIMIGWNGEKAASKTNRATNPLLQDVNIGWIEKVRSRKPTALMGYQSDGQSDGEDITVGEGGSYSNLDSLVFECMGSLLDPWFVGSQDLVLILGRELWVKHGLSLYSAANNAATELNALNLLYANQLIGGLRPVLVPFVPPRGLFVTSFDNLSLYYQSGGMRRAIVDNPKRDRVEDYLSSNDAYVVEDYGKFGGVRPGAIKLKSASGEWV
jgi:P2 family phage major capsid protein